MPAIAPQSHHRVLNAIQEIQAEVRGLRSSTKPMTGYMGFDLTESILGALHDAVAKTTDRDLIVRFLKTAVGASTETGGGEVRPAVDRARKEFKVIWEELEKL
jgi:hypothetical protein